MENNTNKQDETNLWKVNAKLLGIAELYKKTYERSLELFGESQELKKKFVKEFKEDDYKAHAEFMSNINVLKEKKEKLNNTIDYIEKFAKEFYGVDLFRELMVKQRIPVAED